MKLVFTLQLLERIMKPGQSGKGTFYVEVSPKQIKDLTSDIVVEQMRKVILQDSIMEEIDLGIMSGDSKSRRGIFELRWVK